MFWSQPNPWAKTIARPRPDMRTLLRRTTDIAHLPLPVAAAPGCRGGNVSRTGFAAGRQAVGVAERRRRPHVAAEEPRRRIFALRCAQGLGWIDGRGAVRRDQGGA